MPAEPGPRGPVGTEAGPGDGRRRGGHRRVDAAGTGPASADGAEPRREIVGGSGGGAAEGPGPAPVAPARERTEPEDEHARWLREQRPPHWG